MRRRVMVLIVPCVVAGLLWLGLAVAWDVRADVAATAHHVAPGGVCGGVTPCYATIQAAVDAAVDGDLIKIAAGTYDDLHDHPHTYDIYYPYTTTQIAIVTKAVTLRGGYLPTDWDKSDPKSRVTTLDAQGQGRGIYAAGWTTVTVEGLRIVNGVGYASAYGEAPGGGAIASDQGRWAALIVRDCVLSGNSGNSGGAIYVHGTSLVLEGSKVVDNAATGTGGGVYVREAVVTMTGNLIADNTADDNGGGAWIYECDSALDHNTFSGNYSGWIGGGLNATWGNLVLTHNEFLNNEADDGGGGLACGGRNPGEVYTFTHNLFQGNIGARYGSASGGGLRISSGGHFYFAYNRVLSNTASLSTTRGSGGGALIFGPAVVRGNLIQGNRGCTGLQCSGTGGGLLLRGDVWVDSNTILDNVATVQPCVGWVCANDMQGGGIFIGNQSVVTLTNNVIARNAYADAPHATYDNGGGAIYIGGQTTYTECRVTLYHNTIADNLSPALLSESAGMMLSHTILSGHNVDVETILDSSGVSPLPLTVLDYTLWWPTQGLDARDGSVITTAHDSVGDPHFWSSGPRHYHLGARSAALDRGPGVGVDVDIDGNSRPLGLAYDLGADESLLLYVPMVLRHVGGAQ